MASFQFSMLRLEPAAGISISGDGGTVGLFRSKKELKFVNLGSGKSVSVTTSGTVRSMTINQDGSLAAAVYDNQGVVDLYNVASGRRLIRLGTSSRMLISVKLNAKGTWLAAGDIDRTLTLIPLGQLQQRLKEFGLEW